MSADRRIFGALPRGQWRWVALLGVLLSSVLSALDLFQHYYWDLEPGVLLMAVGLVRGANLAWAWSRPQVGLVIALFGTAVLAFAEPRSSSEPWPWAATAVFGYAIILIIAGARGMSRQDLIRWWLAAQVLSVILYIPGFDLATTNFASGIVMAIVSGVGVVLGDLLRSRSETRLKLAEQEVISEAERGERTRLQERARIARELHDVVAHHLSVVVVRADSAPHRLADVPEEVRQEFAEISTAARASLTEMRRVLRLLRADEQQELEPQPGLDQLPELIGTARQAGAAVSLDVEELEGIDPAVQLTVYRVVQEALSNAVRHAPRSAVRVLIRRAYGRLRVDVVNAPSAAPAAAAGSGHGLKGMRERVELVDGTIVTGATPDGGYQVCVEIPVGGE